jgi:ribosome biogenesis GTPase
VSPGRRRRPDLDEDDIRVRPGRGSRPRSKERPTHADAISAVVTAIDRGRYTCLVDDVEISGDGTPAEQREVTAMKARELGRRAVVVGDRVWLVGDVSGAPDTLTRIVRVSPRVSTLRRTADDSDPVERVIVANADQLVVVTSTTNPEPRPRLVDRCLVAAYDAGLDPLLCITKTDLAPPDQLLDAYRSLDVPWVAISKGEVTAQLTRSLADRRSVLVGHSGVGKSTLVNALVPGSDRAVGRVNPVTGRGRHTSASAIALPLPGGGWVVDTPGVRSFGLAHVAPSRILSAFPDLAEGAADCPRGCPHTADALDCALDAWVASGKADPARLVSFRRLLASRQRHADD